VAGFGPFCGEDWYPFNGENWYTLSYHLQKEAFQHFVGLFPEKGLELAAENTSNEQLK
jgi:hypothetical protein